MRRQIFNALRIDTDKDRKTAYAVETVDTGPFFAPDF